MVEFKRSIRCSNCGTETSFYLSSDMALNELLIHGKCQHCGNSLQLNYNLVEREERKESSESQSGEEASVNLDESIFNEPDFPSDAIKDLMGN